MESRKFLCVYTWTWLYTWLYVLLCLLLKSELFLGVEQEYIGLSDAGRTCNIHVSLHILDKDILGLLKFSH